jgi:hypothetical protein
MGLSREEISKIEADADMWTQKVNKVLHNDFNELELYILKSHLLLEYELNKYIEIRTKKRLSMEKAGFTFATKMKILKMLGCFEDEGVYNYLEEFLKTLNIIRNQIAHTFSFDKKVLNRLSKICKNINPDREFGSERAMIDYVVSYFAGGLPYKAVRDLLHDASITTAKDLDQE